MTRTNETKGLTEKAFWEIISTGKPPTIDLVNDWMLLNEHGKRQRNTISDALKKCWDDLGKRAQQTRTIPGIPDETVALVVSLRDNLMALARKEFQEDRAEAERRHANSIESAEAKAMEAQAAVARAREDLMFSEQRYEKLTAEFDNSQRRVNEMESALAVEVGRNQDHINRISELESDNVRLTAEISAAADSHRAMIDAENKRYTAMQHSLLQQYDDEKTRNSKLTKQIEKLEDRIVQKDDAAQKRLHEANDQRMALSAELGKAQGVASALQQQVAGLQSSLEQKITDLNIANQKAIALLAKLNASDEKITSLAGITPVELREIIVDALVSGCKHLSAKAAAKGSKEAPVPTMQERAENLALEILKANRIEVF